MADDFGAALVGDWRLDRTVSDGPAMSGTARFTRLPDGSLRYHEEGTLTLPGDAGTTLQFSRGYLYRFDGRRLTIFFDEATPRLFEVVELTGDATAWRGNGDHLCAPDTYVSRYAFDAATGFDTSHRVDGPRKAYRIDTRYTR